MANHPQSAPGGRTPPQQHEQVVSDYSLSASTDGNAGENAEDGRYSVAEEQNFDQQSDQARRVGRAPDAQDGAVDAMAKSLQEDGEQSQDALRRSMERAVPRGD